MSDSIADLFYPSGGTASAVTEAKIAAKPDPAFQGMPLEKLPVAADPRTVSPGAQPAPRADIADAFYPSTAAPDAPFDPSGFALPEGLEADPALMGEFGTTAKELGLTREGAERLVAIHAKAAQAAQAAQASEIAAWESRAHAELGHALPQIAAEIRDAVGEEPEFFEIMDRTGLGSHPAVLRVLARLARGR